MAVNKRKILESARKLAQKGSKEKALAEYQKLLKLDPKDAKLRLEIGDAHRRWGQVEQAVETYTRVADQYMGEGFDARAVAVFKQILNLDPDRFDAYGPLAELYERMGLTAEAISALQTAADGYHRQGRKDEALGLLRKMANVDPSNTTSRIKVADLLRQQEKTQDAITEYRLAAEELERQGDVETLGSVYRRILEVDEKHVDALHKLAKNLAARGKVSEAVPLAERAMQLDDANPEHYEMLADLFERANRPGDRAKTIRALADLYRQRGDDDRARDLLQRVVSAGDLSAGAVGDEFAGSDAELFDQEFPDTEGSPELSMDFGNDVGLDSGSSKSGSEMGPMLGDEPVAGEASEELLLDEVAPAASASAPPVQEADIEQLLAEATVYLRYGKSEKAIAHLESVVAASPDHRGALEKLGEAFAENGENERAVELWLRAARGARDEGDEDGLRVLRGRIAVLDESAAESLGSDAAAAQASPSEVVAAPPLDELEFDAGHDDDLLLDDDEFLDEVPGVEAPDAAEDALEIDAGGETPGIEIEVAEDDAPEVAIDLPEEDDDPTGGIDASEPGIGASEEEDAEIEIDIDAGIAEAEPAAAASEAGQSLSASAKQRVLDELEEADFYMEQGLHGEAEVIYRKVLADSPGHPRALLRLGEIAAARGETPEGAPEVDSDATPVPDIDLDEEDSFTAGIDAPEPSVDVPAEDVSDLDIDAAEVAAEDEVFAPDSDTQELRANAAASGEVAEAGRAVSPAIEGAEGDFDLAAALADAFDDDTVGGAPMGSSPSGDGFDAVFDAFKKGVSETLAEGDHQAHYDLAIAYKEMGLLDDAINELRTAMADPGRTAECLHLIGLCAIDADRAPLAVEHLEQLLTLSGLDVGAVIAARFDLGRAFEAMGDLEGARREWGLVVADAPDFQDVTARLAGLGEAKPEDEVEDDAGFESFDDVLEGLSDDDAGEDGASAGPDQGFAELVPEDATPGEAIQDAEPIEEGVPEPAPGKPAPAARPKPAAKRKKKKISFL